MLFPLWRTGPESSSTSSGKARRYRLSGDPHPGYLQVSVEDGIYTRNMRKCGFYMVVVLASKPCRVECHLCGHHVDFLSGTALPDDCYKQLGSILTIYSFDSRDQRLLAATELRSLLSIRRSDALKLVRSLPVIIDWEFEQGTWKLIEFYERLNFSGISCTITRTRRR